MTGVWKLVGGPSKVGPITKKNGIAGNFALQCLVWYDGETQPYRVAFHGSRYGCPGPVVMAVTNPENKSGQDFVNYPAQYGARLDEQWVRNFYDVDDKGKRR